MRSVNLIDSSSLFDAGLILAKFSKLKTARIDYKELLSIIGEKDKNVALCSIKTSSDSQNGFVKSLRLSGYDVDLIDFAKTFTSHVDRSVEKTKSLSSRLCYMLGKVSSKKDLKELTVVSHSFEIYEPLLDLIKKTGAKVTVAYFSDLIDSRWGHAGLFEEDFPINFINLNDSFANLTGFCPKQLLFGNNNSGFLVNLD